MFTRRYWASPTLEEERDYGQDGGGFKRAVFRVGDKKRSVCFLRHPQGAPNPLIRETVQSVMQG